jgi:site-specific DNA recombinase
VHCFIVAKFDRAHRHQENLLVFERELKEKDIAFLSVAELLDSSSPTGRLMFQILGSFAEFERNVINERTKQGRKATLAKQEYAGGRPPMGYNATWDVVSDESKLVQQIYSGYLACGSLGKLQQKLVKVGYEFSRQALYLILTNRAYLGEYRYDGHTEHNGVLLKNHHQPLINKIIFGKVQAALARNCRRSRK